MTWIDSVGLPIARGVLLALALWSWAAFVAAAVARVVSGGGYLTASWRTVWLSAASSAVFVTAMTLLLSRTGDAELFGIHQLAVAERYKWWAWAGILLCEVLVSVVKVLGQRSLLREAAARNRGPVLITPVWTELVDRLVEAVVDGVTHGAK